MDSVARKLQQSHHCGIETSPAPTTHHPTVGSNRTIVGLKPSNMPKINATPSKQQSHHCGIETDLRRRGQSFFVQQQSHHCGIETKLQEFELDGARFAAIAPLWD